MKAQDKTGRNKGFPKKHLRMDCYSCPMHRWNWARNRMMLEKLMMIVI